MPDPAAAQWLWIGVLILAVWALLNARVVLRIMARPVPAEPSEAQGCSVQDPGSCRHLFHSPTARLIGGIPNALLGQVFYGLVVGTALASLGGGQVPRLWVGLLALAGTAAVVVSAYLLWNLVVVRRVRCRYCFLGQGLNLALLTLLVALYLRPNGWI
ncbi:MAG TPA: vitamin K epoxide reductase family protein [bacterium]|nr:vitamin K epoxide reductase family protein [bacterium]